MGTKTTTADKIAQMISSGRRHCRQDGVSDVSLFDGGIKMRVWRSRMPTVTLTIGGGQYTIVFPSQFSADDSHNIDGCAIIHERKRGLYVETTDTALIKETKQAVRDVLDGVGKGIAAD